jgi:hypothetical protein
LAIRYAILFWILRINPADYIADHKSDTYDGLIARGWIGTPDTSISPVPSSDGLVYLGNSSSHWWSRIFPNADFSASQASNDPWFKNLHFSIQNPILSFCADVVSVVAFFAMMFLIYGLFKWFIRTVTPIKEKKQKARDEAKALKKSEKEKVWLEQQEKIKSDLENQRISEVSKEIKKFEEKVAEDFPAGIMGLPIEREDLTKEEVREMDEKIEIENNLLLNYVPKNNLKNKNLIKIKIDDDVKDFNQEKNKNIESVENLRADRINKMQNLEFENRKRGYKEKWNIIINYMEGKEEALWRIGILEADNLLSDILDDRGYVGMTVSDKLKSANFNTLDLAWAAHKMRNRIAHDGSKFVLTDRMARNTLELFRSVFTELKVFE